MAKKTQTKQEQISQEEQYIAFLQKRLASEHYKEVTSKEDYAKEKAKYEKAKFKLKMLKEQR
jgi:hypothetical protein